jgi:hypothetical protein
VKNIQFPHEYCIDNFWTPRSRNTDMADGWGKFCSMAADCIGLHAGSIATGQQSQTQ